MPLEPPNPYQLRGVALSVTICTVFALGWGISGSVALAGSWQWLAAALVLTVTVALFRTAATFRQSAKHVGTATSKPSINPFRTSAYRLAVGAEIIAIPVAGRLLSELGYTDAVMSAVALIVGLHFFGLVPAFRSPYFAWVGVAFCGLALVSLALPVQVPLGDEEIGVRSAFVGLGCAVILWLGVLPMVVGTRLQLGMR